MNLQEALMGKNRVYHTGGRAITVECRYWENAHARGWYYVVLETGEIRKHCQTMDSLLRGMGDLAYDGLWTWQIPS